MGKQDYKGAFELYKQASEKGSIKATYNLGNSYYYGDGTEQDLNEAFKLYENITLLYCAMDKYLDRVLKQLQ